MREDRGLTIDVLIMDDDSRDGSVELIAARQEKWVQLIVRTAARASARQRWTVCNARVETFSSAWTQT